MFARLSISNQNGFTLIELISVMVILSVMATVVTKKFDFLSDTASQKALVAGVSELNARESLTWVNMKLSTTGWTNDAELFDGVDTNLGGDYEWTAGPNTIGGKLSFDSESIIVNRTASTASTWGRWN
jgi:prepilin-type N-terminal cleavage/methylation domain-containing protein